METSTEELRSKRGRVRNFLLVAHTCGMEMIRVNKSFLLLLAQAGFELAMDGVKDNVVA